MREVCLRQGTGDRRASLMLLWLMFGAHPARVPRRLGSTRPLSATRPGKRALLVFAMPARSDWLHAHAIRRKRPDVHDVDVRAGAETSAVCARVRARLRVVEVNQPHRHARQRLGKSDPIDAELAARAALSRAATAVPKQTSGIVEAIRQLMVVRTSALKVRKAALQQLNDWN